jgi:hypothetical protein
LEKLPRGKKSESSKEELIPEEDLAIDMALPKALSLSTEEDAEALAEEPEPLTSPTTVSR